MTARFPFRSIMICTRRRGPGRSCGRRCLPGAAYCALHRAERHAKKSELVPEQLAAAEAICWLCAGELPLAEGHEGDDPWEDRVHADVSPSVARDELRKARLV